MFGLEHMAEEFVFDGNLFGIVLIQEMGYIAILSNQSGSKWK